MNMYELRDEHGILKAKICKRDALTIINEGQGEFQERNYQGRGKVAVFVLTNHSKWGTRFIELFLWKGDYLRPE